MLYALTTIVWGWTQTARIEEMVKFDSSQF